MAARRSGERHGALDDAVRALRRPRSWPRERAQVADWARRLLADDSLAAVDIETTGLNGAWAVQIAATDKSGTVLFDSYVNPQAGIEPGAIAVHKITPERVADAPTFGELLPALGEALHGRTCVAYNLPFDKGCLERELERHSSAQVAARWLGECRWHDAMEPYAVWKGLWSVKRGATARRSSEGRTPPWRTAASSWRGCGKWQKAVGSSCPKGFVAELAGGASATVAGWAWVRPGLPNPGPGRNPYE
ncbi:hypothetical protein SHKM778_94840 (plasmid) [Streptomyces sp. KM77-8]|uniref:Exonuclease domain-containing protein n=1 Tax=Streptomyces haneummycinicus TaxID=3074435 RepID=A0AAT9HZV5_9ACTN